MNRRKPKPLPKQARDLQRAIDDFLRYRDDIPWVYGITGQEVPADMVAMMDYLEFLSAQIKSELKPKRVK